jgi:hypothetical protein
MDDKELMDRVRALRARGCSPKQIARALGMRPATVTPLIQAIAAEEHADPAQPAIVGCWVSPGWSDGLTVDGHTGWPDVDAADSGSSGLVAVLVARDARRGKISVCGYLVDVYCLGVKNALGPRVVDDRRLVQLRRSFFDAYHTEPIAAPVELAQHLVFGAVEYARSLGFAPHPDFHRAAAHLEPWTGPSAIRFGRHGKPYFISGPYDDTAGVLNTLERSVGRDRFHFLVSA